MRYLSVCSGIEAAFVAWKPLGWQCAGVSEIEAFPRAVLQQRLGAVQVDFDDHRWTEGSNITPLFGDFTQIKEHHVGPIDLLVGGTPCQSFSIAGKRLGLDDPRGHLTLEFLALAQRLRPRWIVWENVPGVLSDDGGRTFGTFLGKLAECGFERWAYRVLDAQYVRVDGFGRAVPQRRRRVFVVGYSGTGNIHPRAVLFDRESLCGNPAPRREAGQGFAADVAPSIVSSGRGVERCGETRGQDPVIAVHAVAPTPNAHYGEKQGLEDQHTRGGEGLFVISAMCLNAGAMRRRDAETETLIPTRVGGFDDADVAHTLRGEGFDPSEDGTSRGTPLVPVAFAENQKGEVRFSEVDNLTVGGGKPGQGYPAICFSAKDYGADAIEDCSPTLRAGGHTGSHANAGVMPAVTYDMRGREGGSTLEGPHDTANIRAASGGSSRSYVAADWRVRRLTPKECSRLQGFPDDWAKIEWRGKPADQCPDGPQYKAYGNSMAVNVMRWMGERIATIETTTKGT